MGKDLSHANAEVAVADIAYFGDKLVLPSDPREMELDEAIDLLERRKKWMNEVVSIKRTFQVFPWDGAHALEAVLTRMFGWAPAIPTGFWNQNPPELISVAVGLGKTKEIPWGKFQLPNIRGAIQTRIAKEGNRFVFQLVAGVMRDGEKTIRKLFDAVEEELKINSIYRGKAVRIRFRDDDGKPLQTPDVSFIDTDIDENLLVYSKSIADAIETNLFTPIRRHDDLAENGLQFKRGVLLGGVYGTGKTLAAKVASKIAVEVGITYIYVPRADELADAIEFAKQYQSPAAVVFCEDIDRAMKGERSVKVDDILNIIDGIDSKNQNVMIVLTTNDLGSITKAMLRPGRLDAVIEVMAPDADAVQKLLRVYGREKIAPDADLSAVGKALDGQIPATIAEVVKRAKLSQLRFQPIGVPVTVLSPEALLDAAQTMTAQLGLLNDKPVVKEPVSIEEIVVAGVKKVLNGTVAHVDAIDNNLRQIAEAQGIELN